MTIQTGYHKQNTKLVFCSREKKVVTLLQYFFPEYINMIILNRYRLILNMQTLSSKNEFKSQYNQTQMSLLLVQLHNMSIPLSVTFRVQHLSDVRTYPQRVFVSLNRVAYISISYMETSNKSLAALIMEQKLNIPTDILYFQAFLLIRLNGVCQMEKRVKFVIWEKDVCTDEAWHY